jgi:hypothetical protein
MVMRCDKDISGYAPSHVEAINDELGALSLYHRT